MKIQGVESSIRKHGSFGMPPEVKKVFEQQQEAKKKEESPEQSPGQKELEFEDEAQEDQEKEASDKKEERGYSPLDALKEIGVTITEDDMYAYLFTSGSISKDITLYEFSDESKNITATFKTLTAGEYDEIDEIMAEEANTIKMTNDGFRDRRNLYILGYSVSKIKGKDLSKKHVMKTEDGRTVPDRKKMAKERRYALSHLAGPLVSKMIETCRIFTVSLNEIVNSKGTSLIKKS
jgi:hypothetical protein